METDCACVRIIGMAERHRSHLPEVTFFATTVVSNMPEPQHDGMRELLRSLLQPLMLSGLLTIGAVAMSLQLAPVKHQTPAWGLLAAYVLLFLLNSPRISRRWFHHAALLTMPVMALWLLVLANTVGTMQILLVIWAAVIAMAWPMRWVLVAVLLVDVAVFFILRAADYSFARGLLVVVLYGSFQAFAVLIAHYAHNAEQARDRLALVNADLLATRALLADGSRDAERLRVARELHDVAGHKLTALRLNLRALSNAENAAPQLKLAEQLSAELLADIRGVVDTLRDVNGLDIATALQALAAPFPLPRLQLMIDESVQITDPALADTVLRLVQEALTNSAKHADAHTLHVTLSKQNHVLRIAIEDDGHLHGSLREGNGLTGMRERVEERGGRISFARNRHHALKIKAELPA